MADTYFYLGTVLTVLVYMGVMKLKKGPKLPLYNSVLYSTIILVIILLISGVDYDSYSVSAAPIANMLGPMVVLLAIPIYKNKALLKKHFKTILLGIAISGTASAGTVVVLSKVFGVGDELMLTLIPKSITTPIAIGMSEMLGGVVSITVVAVIITGILGASIIQYIIRFLKLSDPIAIGVALGSASHGVGTSKALELSEEIGAISGLSMGLTGIIYILTASVGMAVF